ncbi:YfcC family protein [Crassaminicella profunda]|uniref:YfcC family protein n=1 Tax=Crassaminicella profunda TaxID=1286698 RepID=UPI001CA7AFEF|nr:AbgT family transporter [Crassaminicella profunda]QZY54506.1 AbgT family transporter [Crassaminicella profunda]
MIVRKWKKPKVLDSYVLIFTIVVILAGLSYIIPAGSYERIVDPTTHITYVKPGSYMEIPRTPVSIFQLFKAIPQGMIAGSNIIIFVFIVGGSFGIINSTGIMDRSIKVLTQKYQGKESLIIPILMTMFAVFGTTFGTAEELLPFCPIIISLFMALGMDRITGLAVVLVGGCTGFAAGVLNPFTTGIAQQIVELPLFSGISLRLATFIIFLVTGIIYVMRYATKIKKQNQMIETQKVYRFKRHDLAIIIVVISSISFIFYGVLSLQFDTIDVSTVFIIMGLAVGIVGGLSSNRIVAEFVKGASALVYGALIIGMAKAVFVVMEYGHISDTIIYYCASILDDVQPVAGSMLMYVFHTVINLFLSSATGQASVTMPIMKNLADLSGITRQTSVLAFQFGDGLSNIMFPTSGYFMACLAITNIKWKEWLKWMMPLFIIFSIEACLILIFSTMIDYGPF